MSSDSDILGVFLLVRHGDRQGFYQDPDTYTASSTTITPLGTVEEFDLGIQLRSIYLTNSSDSFISGMNDTFNTNQVQVQADAGDEGGVIFDSAVALLQGLFPPNNVPGPQLANGSFVTSPLGGYQYVPIDAVNANEDVSLEGFADCNTFNDATVAFYNSSEFSQMANESAAFLSAVQPFLDGRPVTLENMFNIYDYINVQSIHNATFASLLPNTFLAQARALANWHEYGVFSSPQLDGIGNIAGQTILPSIITGLNQIANASNPLKFYYTSISYKPFLSLFNMTGVAEANPELAGIVSYAAAVALEVRQSSSANDPVVRFLFKNGTDASNFTQYNLFGASGDVPLSQFVSTLAPVAINTTQEWCNVCQNSQDRGCGALAAAAASASASALANNGSPHERISPVGAGFLGAGLTLVVVAFLAGTLAFLGVLALGRRTTREHTRKSSDRDSNEQIDVKS